MSMRSLGPEQSSVAGPEQPDPNSAGRKEEFSINSLLIRGRATGRSDKPKGWSGGI